MIEEIRLRLVHHFTTVLILFAVLVFGFVQVQATEAPPEASPKSVEPAEPKSDDGSDDAESAEPEKPQDAESERAEDEEAEKADEQDESAGEEEKVYPPMPVEIGSVALDEATATVLAKPLPENVSDLRAIEAQTRAIAKKVHHATVAVNLGQGWGSGVIISEDGYVMTAGHVSGEPGKKVTFVFPNGRKVKGESLGRNNRIDSGMMKITEEGSWPYVEMAETGVLSPGTWCVAIGHPGGFDEDRPYVVRLGRVVRANVNVIQSDCTLVGGDSGGPLFDMQGRIIGIHSRIASSISGNFHVPIDTYHETWDRLVAGEEWGGNLMGTASKGAYLGIRGASHRDGVLVTRVNANSPAAKGGMKAGDIITRFNGESFAGWDQFGRLMRPLDPGTEVVIELRRGDSEFSIKTKLLDGRLRR